MADHTEKREEEERERGERRLAALIAEDAPRWRVLVARWREDEGGDAAEEAGQEIADELAAYGVVEVEQRVFNVSAGVRLVAERRGGGGVFGETEAWIEYHPAPVDVRFQPRSGWIRAEELDDAALGMAEALGLVPEWIAG